MQDRVFGEKIVLIYPKDRAHSAVCAIAGERFHSVDKWCGGGKKDIMFWLQPLNHIEDKVKWYVNSLE